MDEPEYDNEEDMERLEEENDLTVSKWENFLDNFSSYIEIPINNKIYEDISYGDSMHTISISKDVIPLLYRFLWETKTESRLLDEKLARLGYLPKVLQDLTGEYIVDSSLLR